MLTRYALARPLSTVRFADTNFTWIPCNLDTIRVQPSGWVAGKSYDPEADAELMAEDRVEAVKRADRKAKSGIISCEAVRVDAQNEGRGSTGGLNFFVFIRSFLSWFLVHILLRP